MTAPQIAVVTGASQGLGLETARQLAAQGIRVVLSGRDSNALAQAVQTIGELAEYHVMDVSDDASVEAFFAWFSEQYSQLYIVVNNAGRVYGGHAATLSESAPETVAQALNNNALGAYRVMRAALPLMTQMGYGRIVNVSSGMGALTDMGAGALPYRVSKTALNAMTVLAATEAPAGVKVNAVCPGWVRTDMGGANATRNVQDGAAGIVWAATLSDDGPTGGFFRDGGALDW